MKKLAKKRICICGAGGVSGISLVKLCLKLDAFVIAADLKKPPVAIDRFLAENLLFRDRLIWTTEKQDRSLLKNQKVDILLASSGIPFDLPIFQAARELKIPLQGELEFSLQLMDQLWQEKPITIAVTGTDGKSTTTRLIEHLLANLVHAKACGNLGLPVSDILLEESKRPEVLIIECSSFQLEWLESFQPNIAMILNIAEDHTDRYDTFVDYIQTKFRIFKFQTAQDKLLIDHSMLESVQTKFLLKQAKSQILAIDRPKNLQDITFRGQEKIFANQKNPSFSLVGCHNLYNLQFALTAVAHVLDILAREISIPEVVKKISSFQTLKHRLQFVGNSRKLPNVCFYNDSKATTVQATKAALHSLLLSDIHSPSGIKIHLLVGGIAKGMNFIVLRQKNVQIYPFGESGQRIARELEMTQSFADLSQAFSLAVQAAFLEAKKTAQQRIAILLSPACASYDAYLNYEDRGEHFCGLVEKYL